MVVFSATGTGGGGFWAMARGKMVKMGHKLEMLLTLPSLYDVARRTLAVSAISCDVGRCFSL